MEDVRMLSEKNEARLREIVRHMRLRAGTHAHAYWLYTDGFSDPAHRYYMTGGKGRAVKLWFTWRKSLRKQSRLVAEIPGRYADATKYAMLSEHIESDMRATFPHLVSVEESSHA